MNPLKVCYLTFMYLFLQIRIESMTYKVKPPAFESAFSHSKIIEPTWLIIANSIRLTRSMRTRS